MVRSRRVWTAARLGAVVALAACSRGEAADAAPAAPALAVPGWSLEPAARVGGADAGEQEQLFTVTGVAEDAEGRFYVASFGDKRILAFDSAGTHLRNLGRGGRGPGEFTAPISLATPGADGLMVLDVVAGRISRFRRSDGQFLGDVKLPEDAGMPLSMRATPAGAVAVEFRPRTQSGVQTPAYLAMVDTATGAVDQAGAVRLDTVARVQVMTESKGAKTVATVDLPFAPRPVWDVDAGGALLYGTGAEFVVSRAQGGRSAPAFRGTGAPREVTSADRDAFFEGDPNAERFRGKVQFPRTHPYFTDLRADPHGSVWLQVPVAEGERWEVRDAAGRVQGTFSLPAGSRLVHVSRGSLYVVNRDENDVETVERLRLRR